MTARLPKRLRDRSRVHADFEAVMNSGAPIVDMIGDGRMEYDGPRCAADDCDTAVDEEGLWCEPCEDAPHEFQFAGEPRWPDWCVCGRIRAALVHQDDDERGAA